MTVRCKVVIFIYAADILLIQTIRHKLLHKLCGGESVFAKFAFPQKPKH